MARGFPEGSSFLQLLNLLKPSQATLTKSSFLQSVVWFGLSLLWEARVSSLLQLLNLLKPSKQLQWLKWVPNHPFCSPWCGLVCHSCGKPECLVDGKQHHVAEPVCLLQPRGCNPQPVSTLVEMPLPRRAAKLDYNSFIYRSKSLVQDKMHFKDCGYMQQQKF